MNRYSMPHAPHCDIGLGQDVPSEERPLRVETVKHVGTSPVAAQHANLVFLLDMVRLQW